jgi:hypothetical protein
MVAPESCRRVSSASTTGTARRRSTISTVRTQLLNDLWNRHDSYRLDQHAGIVCREASRHLWFNNETTRDELGHALVEFTLLMSEKDDEATLELPKSIKVARPDLGHPRRRRTLDGKRFPVV